LVSILGLPARGAAFLISKLKLEGRGVKRMDLNRTFILTSIAAIVVAAALWLTNQVVTPKEATWDDVNAEARSGGYRLITTQELASMYSQRAPLVIDTRQEWRKADSLKELLGQDKDRVIVFY